MWDKLKQTLLSPKLDDEDLEERLHQVKAQLPIPVFWLLGKAQSGKTSLIRALTGNSRAAIGDGIRPCTRTTFVYDFPDAQDCFMKFLDTRGLGEIDYDPAEDIGIYQEQAHLLIVVMKAMDHAQQTVMDVVRKITRERPDWPLIVVQSTLHEGYPDPASEHILPYPYHHGALPDAAPQDLVRSLAKQREMFTELDAHFAAVDFTLPEDAFKPKYYGLDALWNTIEDVLPLGLAGMVRDTENVRKKLKDAYAQAAHPHIVGYSLAAGAAGAIPVPFVDLPLVTVIQAKLSQSIASIYEQKLDQRRIGEISSALGLGFLTNLGRRELMKFIPVYGSAVSSLATAATTYALGKTLAAYFDHTRRGAATDSKLFQRLYAEQFEQGKQLLQNYLHAPGDKDLK